jgi:hypothetical protein
MTRNANDDAIQDSCSFFFFWINAVSICFCGFWHMVRRVGVLKLCRENIAWRFDESGTSIQARNRTNLCGHCSSCALTKMHTVVLGKLDGFCLNAWLFTRWHLAFEASELSVRIVFWCGLLYDKSSRLRQNWIWRTWNPVLPELISTHP